MNIGTGANGYREWFDSIARSRELRVYGQFDTAAQLKPGHLLVVTVPMNVCWQFDPTTGDFRYLFELNWDRGSLLWRVVCNEAGEMYCTMSGLASSPPIVDTAFGTWGAIVRANHRTRKITTLAVSGSGPVVDPFGLQILEDGRLLITDFNDFGGTGSIYKLDPSTGVIDVIAKGGRLQDPTNSWADRNGVIWVANGDQENQDGEVIGIRPDGTQSVLIPREGPDSGAVLGIWGSNHPDEVIVSRNEWDRRIKSRVVVANTQTGEVTTLLEGSPEHPQFFGTVGDVIGDTMWVAECCDKHIIEYDLQNRRVRNRHDLSRVMGNYRGMRDSFDSVPSISIVPKLRAAQA